MEEENRWVQAIPGNRLFLSNVFISAIWVTNASKAPSAAGIKESSIENFNPDEVFF